MICSWPLDKPAVPFLNRKKYEHTIIHKAPRTVNDDILNFNTQSSSQWDSFRHFAYQEQKQFYNGVTMESVKGDKATTRNGIQGGLPFCDLPSSRFSHVLIRLGCFSL
jgi:hypothetical protein